MANLQAEGNIVNEGWLSVPGKLRRVGGLDGRLDNLEKLVEGKRDVPGRELFVKLIHRDANGGSSQDAELAVDVAAKVCGCVEGVQVRDAARVDRHQGLSQTCDVTRDGVASLLDAFAA